VNETMALPENPRMKVSTVLGSVPNVPVPIRVGAETSLNCWNRSITS
jgi:hypothetical protein